MKPNPQDFAPFEEAYEVIAETCKGNYTPETEVRQALQLTPGQFYAPGTTWDNILCTLESVEWIERTKIKGIDSIKPIRELDKCSKE